MNPSEDESRVSAPEDPPVEVPKEQVRVEDVPPERRNIFGNTLGAASAIASAVEAAAEVPKKFGASEAAAKMRGGAAAVRAVAGDAARVIEHGRVAAEQAAGAIDGAKQAIGSAKEFLAKLPPMKVQERPSLTRTRRRT